MDTIEKDRALQLRCVDLYDGDKSDSIEEIEDVEIDDAGTPTDRA